jgi:hypothetical protein
MGLEIPAPEPSVVSALFAASLVNGASLPLDAAADGETIDFNGTTDGLDFATKSGSTYSLIRTGLVKNFIIRAGVSVKFNGYGLIASGRATIEVGAILHCDGNAAAGGVAGTGQGTAGGANAGPMQLQGSAAGATGRSTTGAGTAGTAAPNSGNLGVWPVGLTASTPTGGAGGSVTSGAGGAGGTSTILAAVNWDSGPLSLAYFTTNHRFFGPQSTAFYTLSCGGGGGAGGCNVTTGTATSGAGGGGGGGGFLHAAELDNGGRITCRGGNGGAAVAAGGGFAGGGGGGRGGCLAILIGKFVGYGRGTIDCNGGDGGLGAGPDGLTGSNGSPGALIERYLG